MSIAELCLLLAALMLVGSKIPLAKAQNDAGGYDNRRPREQQAALTGWGARALAAHQNLLEAFPLFAAGVLLAEFKGAPQGSVDAVAVAFVAARVLYQIFYLADRAKLRSLSWVIGYGCSIALLLAPAWG